MLFAVIYWGVGLGIIYFSVYFLHQVDPKFRYAPSLQFEIDASIFVAETLPSVFCKGFAFWWTRNELSAVGFQWLLMFSAGSAVSGLLATALLGPIVMAWAMVDMIVTIMLVKRKAAMEGY